MTPRPQKPKFYVRCEANNWTSKPFPTQMAADAKIESILKGKDTCQEAHTVIVK